MFQFKCLESKTSFFNETNSRNDLSSCFTKDDNFELCSKNFFRTLNRKLHKCFNKVRIKTGKSNSLGDPIIQQKLEQKTKLKLFMRSNKCKIEQKNASDKK